MCRVWRKWHWSVSSNFVAGVFVSLQKTLLCAYVSHLSPFLGRWNVSCVQPVCVLSSGKVPVGRKYILSGLLWPLPKFTYLGGGDFCVFEKPKFFWVPNCFSKWTIVQAREELCILDAKNVFGVSPNCDFKMRHYCLSSRQISRRLFCALECNSRN